MTREPARGTLPPVDKPTLPRRDRRIVRHIQAIEAAGTSIEGFQKAIAAVRDDPNLSAAMREAIWKTLAQQAGQAYYVFTTGQPIDMDAMIEAFEKQKKAQNPG